MTDAHHHGEHTSGHHVWYFGVFLALCVLTGISVLCDLVHFPVHRFHGINPLLAAMVLAVAACKALFVMRNFMHLKFEGKWKFLLLVPTAILALGLALDGVDFAVETGAIFGLLGPNGGGKTTLFRILSTLLPIQSGSAAVLGLDLARRPNDIRRQIGVTFQSPSIDPKLTVWENLKHQGHLYGLSGRTLSERIDLLTGRLGLKERLS